MRVDPIPTADQFYFSSAPPAWRMDAKSSNKILSGSAVFLQLARGPKGEARRTCTAWELKGGCRAAFADGADVGAPTPVPAWCCAVALCFWRRERRVMLTSVESTIKMGGVLTLIKQIGALFSLPALVAQRCYPSVLGGRAAELCSAGRVPSVGVENAPILSLQSLRATQRNPSSPGR